MDGGGLAFWAEDLVKDGSPLYTVVLTPHPKEAQDLLQILGVPQISRLAKHRAKLFSELKAKLNFLGVPPYSALILKGAYPLCGEINDTKAYVFDIADSRLASQGSGDVLSGVIAAYANKLAPAQHHAMGACVMGLMNQKHLLMSSPKIPVIIARDQILQSVKLSRSLMTKITGIK